MAALAGSVRLASPTANPLMLDEQKERLLAQGLRDGKTASMRWLTKSRPPVNQGLCRYRSIFKK